MQSHRTCVERWIYVLFCFLSHCRNEITRDMGYISVNNDQNHWRHITSTVNSIFISFRTSDGCKWLQTVALPSTCRRGTVSPFPNPLPSPSVLQQDNGVPSISTHCLTEHYMAKIYERKSRPKTSITINRLVALSPILPRFMTTIMSQLWPNRKLYRVQSANICPSM